MLTTCTLISILWIYMNGQDSKSVADMYANSQFTITGFRNNNLHSRFAKKIEPAAIIGGVIVGLITILSDAIGCLTSGMGLMICVSTIYDLYDKVYEENKKKRIE